MAGLIRLRPQHTEIERVKHPLLEGAKAVPIDELEAMAKRVARGGSGDELIMALRAPLRNLVGKYLYYFPTCRQFEDEMVSEGLTAFSALISDISLDFLAGRAILSIALRRAEDAINVFINSNQGVAAASMCQQKKLVKNGKDPVYITAEVEVSELNYEQPSDLGDEKIRDVLDALSMIEPQDEIDEFILDPFNWGRGYQELADDLGVGVGTIHRRKTRLYKKYLEITR
jgi:hypothetical protein